MNRLDPIITATREELARRRATVAEETLLENGAARTFRAFAEALTDERGLSVIAEHKRRSPSAGLIREDLALEDVVRAYERGGAAALSILTEPFSFGGSLTDLESARAASALPILRKDFIVDSYQLSEALAAGADAILLIVAALDRESLAGLHARAGELGLAALVEVHDERELQVAVDLGAWIIGVNNRDLTTLEVDTRRTFDLVPMMPPGTIVVAESGFSSRSELDELAAAGVDAVLVGEALMRAPDVEAACRALAARAATI